MFILDQTQEQRDDELSFVTGIPIGDIKAIEMCSPSTIRIYDEKEDVKDIVSLYHSLKHIDLLGYYRTLMMTSVERRHPNLIDLLRTSTGGKRCLDFGSGVGTHAIALMQRGNKVSLLDVQGPLRELAIRRIDYRGLFGSLDTVYNHDSVLPLNTFDLVLCADVLEHVPDPLEDLRRIHKCMKPGAVLHLEVSTMIKPSSGHFPSSIQKWKEEGVKYLSSEFMFIKPTIFRRN